MKGLAMNIKTDAIIHTAVLVALKAIVIECTDDPNEPRYSTDSYLPAHMLKAAQQAIDATARGYRINTDKLFATVQARWALAEVTLHQLEDDHGTTVFIVSRLALTSELADLNAVAFWLDRVTALKS